MTKKLWRYLMDSLNKYTFLFNVEGLDIIRGGFTGLTYPVSFIAIGGQPCITQYFGEEPEYESYKYVIRINAAQYRAYELIKHMPLEVIYYCLFEMGKANGGY